MKRIGGLIKSIADMENLYLAWIKARRGKMKKEEVQKFESELDFNLSKLRRQLLDGEVKVGNYSYFTIKDPKKRLICAASFPERVLHHAIMNVCEPIFERHLIFDTYATRKRKGTYAALDRAQSFNKKNIFFVKLDVRKYFDSISHHILIDLLSRLFKDKKLLGIYEQIITSYSTGKDKGLPIGNLTSQFFANYYLSFADHYAKENLKLRYYVRYMDDIVFWGDDREELKIKTLEFVDFVNKSLYLLLKPAIINKTKNGLPFLGYKLYKFYVKLNRRSKLRFKRKYKFCINVYESGNWTEKELQKHLMPLFAFVDYADTFLLRKYMLNGYKPQR